MTLAFVSALAALLPGPAADEWPEYRGPSGDGHSIATGLPLKFSDTEHVKWKTAIHGRGWSTPVIRGNQVWLTTATEDGRSQYVVCVDRGSGQILLDKKLFDNANPDPIADINSYASPSPVIDDGRVYVHFGTYGTACLDTRTLQVVWTRSDLHIRHSVGPGSSPVLFENLLILTFDGTDTQFVIALNKRTGETVWKKPRANQSGSASGDVAERRKAFGTPLLVKIGGKQQLISPAADCCFAYDPRTGDELWRIRYVGYSMSSRTLIGNGLAFINTGYDKASLYAVRLGGSGDLTDSNVVWKTSKNVPFKPSAILIDDLYYMVDDSGTATCLDAKSGDEIWKERMGGHYSASPVYVDGRIYWPSQEGAVTVTKPGRKLEILAQNQFPAGFMASPAIAGKAFYLRTRTHLYRIEE